MIRRHTLPAAGGQPVRYRAAAWRKTLVLPAVLLAAFQVGAEEAIATESVPQQHVQNVSPHGWAAYKPVTSQDLTAAPQISEYITDVLRDSRGNLWLGTLDDGLCRYDGSNLDCFNEAEGYAGRAARASVEDRHGNVWFATQNGVTRYDGTSFRRFSTADGLPSNQAWSILLDRNGTLWIGTLGGVSRFDGEAFSDFPLPRADVADPEPRFSTALAFSITEDRAGNLWFGTDGLGAVKYDGDTFSTYTEQDGLAGNSVSAIVEDRHGHLWFGSRSGGGISRYDGARFTTFTKKDGLAADTVWTALQDHDGNLWFGTSGGGLSRYDGTSFLTITEDQGVTGNHVQSIFQDKAGTLWFGFSGGLFRLDVSTSPGGKPRLINVTSIGPWGP